MMMMKGLTGWSSQSLCVCACLANPLPPSTALAPVGVCAVVVYAW